MFHALIEEIIVIQKSNKKKFEEIDIMAPMTHDSLKTSTNETVSIRLQRKAK
jgi:hypothetical protein